MKRLVLLGGSYGTGKTTILNHIQGEKGDRWHYVPDPLEKLILEHPTAFFDLDILREVYREAICEYIVGVKNHNGRVTVCDGSVIDIAAKAQGVFDTYDFLWVNQVLKDLERVKPLYIKLPLTQEQRTKPYDFQIIEQHHRIDRILKKNPLIQVEYISKYIQDMGAKYRRVLGVMRSAKVY